MKSPSEKTIRNFVASGLAPACRLKSSAAAIFKLSLIPVNEDCGTSKGDVTRDDWQRRFLEKHSVASWSNVVTIRNNVATMLQPCVALKIVVENRLV